MQKNKFVHADIKAVCNRAAKRLFSLGAAGAFFIAFVPNIALAGGCHSHFGRRQTTSEQQSERNSEVNTSGAELSPRRAAIIQQINADLDAGNVEVVYPTPMPPEMLQAINEQRRLERRRDRLARFQNLINRVIHQNGTNDESNQERDESLDIIEFYGDSF